MKRKASKLDEQQEFTLLNIEHRCFWLIYWGLFVVQQAEMWITDDWRAFIGDLILLLAVSVYLCASCIRAGIWSRTQNVDRKSCLIAATQAAVLLIGIQLAVALLRDHGLQPRRLAVILFFSAVAFVMTYLGTSLMARATRKRQETLNAEPAEDPGP